VVRVDVVWCLKSLYGPLGDGKEKQDKSLISHNVSFKATTIGVRRNNLQVGSDCIKVTESHFCRLKNALYVNDIRIEDSSAKII
jgi:hypothetical protein